MENKASIGTARNKARQLLKEIGIKQAPVSIRQIVKHLQETHDFNISAYGNLPKGTDALLHTDSTSSTLLFDPNNPENRKRFTIAHEIGHLMLDHTQHGWCKRQEEGKKDPKEVEADEFAGELLMPLDLFKKDLNSNIDIDALAKKYMVSKEAAGVRASKLI